MAEFIVEGISLSPDERFLLFGSKTELAAIKITNVENYFGMLKAVHNGDTVLLPDSLEMTADTFVYVYCDLPVGARYFYDLSMGRKPSASRATIADLPQQYATYEAVEFCYPFINNWLETVCKDYKSAPKFSSENYLEVVGAKKQYLLDTIMSSMLLTLCNNRVVSCVSFSTLSKHIADFRPQINSNLSETSMYEAYKYMCHMVPRETYDDIPPETFPVKEFVEKVAKLQNFKAFFDTLFTWSFTIEHPQIIIGKDYFRLNSLTSHKNKTLFTFHYNSPLLQTAVSGYSNGDSYKFSESFQSFFDKKTAANFGAVVNSGNSYYRTYGRAGASFVFLNKESLHRSAAELQSGLPEYLELDPEFFTSVDEAFNDVSLQKNAGITLDAAVKATFALKKDVALNESETASSRYDTIKSVDGKLFILAKTSKTRDALKQSAISRKITTSISDLLGFVIRIYAAKDLTTGNNTERNYNFSVSSRRTFNNPPAVPDYTSGIKTTVDKFMKVLCSQEYATKIETFVTNLYTKTVLSEQHPLLELAAPPFNATYRNSYEKYVSFSATDQQARAYGYLWADVRGALRASIFSPSSNQIDFRVLGTEIYRQLNYWSKTAENAPLISMGGNGSLSGVQAAYLYTANFIEDNVEFSQTIETNKNNHYIYFGSSMLLASSCFNWSQDVLDAFAAVKKCKTFTDYYTWYEQLLPALKETIKELFETPDPNLCEALLAMSSEFLQIMFLLKEKETPFLPKASVKKRGRKKKESAEEDIEVTDEAIDELPTTEILVEETTNDKPSTELS